VFKLESPVNAESLAEDDADAQALFAEMGRLAGRPWVMLSAGAGKKAFRTVLSHAYRAGASGYLAGRAIWLDAFSHFPDWKKMQAGLENESAAYVHEINALTEAKARPWHRHPCYGAEGPGLRPADGTFKAHYRGFE
jgi:tagatose 1,6-diphosphate aldolase